MAYKLGGAAIYFGINTARPSIW